MGRKTAALIALLALISVLASLRIDSPSPAAVGIVDLGTCGPFSYNYTTDAVKGLVEIDQAEFYSSGANSTINAISIQLNVFAESDRTAYWAQNVLLLTEENGTYRIAVADYLFNISNYGVLEVRGSGNVVEYVTAGHKVSYYQSSTTLGGVTLPLRLGLMVVANGSSLYFYYYDGAHWVLYDVVTVGDRALKLYVGPGRELEFVLAGPREGYTAHVLKWEGKMELYYHADGGWYAPPCAYSGSRNAVTAERTSFVEGVSEYYDGSAVVQTAGRSDLGPLWTPSALVEPVPGGVAILLTPPDGRWELFVNGASVAGQTLQLRPGMYNITAVLYAGDFIVYRRVLYVKTS
ncbi:MAG: thermopsin family protease [Thermoproteus sp.]